MKSCESSSASMHKKLVDDGQGFVRGGGGQAQRRASVVAKARRLGGSALTRFASARPHVPVAVQSST